MKGTGVFTLLVATAASLVAAAPQFPPPPPGNGTNPWEPPTGPIPTPTPIPTPFPGEPIAPPKVFKPRSDGKAKEQRDFSNGFGNLPPPPPPPGTGK